MSWTSSPHCDVVKKRRQTWGNKLGITAGLGIPKLTPKKVAHGEPNKQLLQGHLHPVGVNPSLKSLLCNQGRFVTLDFRSLSDQAQVNNQTVDTSFHNPLCVYQLNMLKSYPSQQFLNHLQ